MSDISEENIKEFHNDMDALGIIRPDRMPRATKCLDEIRSMIEKLEEKGAAYSVDGDVYFSVMKHSKYGKLSRRDLSDQQLNADGRISQEEGYKKNNPFESVFVVRKTVFDSISINSTVTFSTSKPSSA